MVNRRIVITGASDGIGAAAARQLSADGDDVVIVGRSPDKTAAVASELGADFFVADFAALAQVRRLATELLDKYDRIDVLANNAGGIMGSTERTVDGFEKTFQVNHLAPFLLTNLLLDRLTASHGVVLNTSSNASRGSRADFNDLDAVQNQHNLFAYPSAKLANILFTKELHRRYHSGGISTAALHPGPVATNFSADAGNPLFGLVYRTPLRRIFLRTPEQGADVLIWLASTTPGVDWESGQYYANRKITKTHKDAGDAELAKRLWDRSADMVGVD
jgi:NAD(P)-dependent dehydrogenase (short-subunit alcohol dehydrogenase family)